MEYLKEKLVFLLINTVAAFALASFLYFMGVQSYFILYTICVWFFPILSLLIYDYIRKNHYYKNLLSSLYQLDQKYLLSEIIHEPDFVDGQILHEIISATNRDMHEHIKEYREKEGEYREYMEAWVHEIKTPIASGKLIIENNKTEITKKIEEEFNKVEAHVEQVLYYARSTNTSEDYIIKKFCLMDSIKNVARKNSKSFIYRKIKLNLGALHVPIYNDAKWVEFIINQVVTNAIKYTKEEEAQISLYAEKNKDNITLIIEDNGVGISKTDLNKIFNKGFTGENGRIFGKSTGMGLYICHKLANKLGLGIKAESNKGVGTKISIIFPVGDFSTME
ncbi:sensor histidine kinase [Paenibacillus filicis]|uniref:histidine kinase n=2 Tax=Paenibacillus filicis TaxID=669464 RepID=A0ABU9DUU8_9BACL